MPPFYSDFCFLCLCGFSHTFEEHTQELENELEESRNQMQEYDDDFEDAL